MATNFELHPAVLRTICGALIHAGVRPVAFTKQMDPRKAALSVYKVHVMSSVDRKGEVKWFTFLIKNLKVGYTGRHWEMPFHEAKSVLPGATWHEL